MGFYEGKLAKNEPKIDKFQNLVITFDSEVLLTSLDHFWCAQISYQVWPNTAKYTKYNIWGAYLGTTNMVKWGVPEKILQNVGQTR